MRTVHCKREPFTHYIGRPGPFGNPFAIGRDGNRAQVIERFEQHARNTPALMQRIKALPSDAVLGCWCKPNACHGDVIAKLHAELNAT